MSQLADPDWNRRLAYDEAGHVLVGLAGSLAEAREMGDADEWARVDERHHIERALRMAKRLGKRGGPPAITPDEAAASVYLDKYWPAVVAVATALLATPRLQVRPYRISS